MTDSYTVISNLNEVLQYLGEGWTGRSFKEYKTFALSLPQASISTLQSL